MTKTLLLGLGGTGSRVVNNVAKELRRKKIGINDGEVCCAVLDTNEKDNKLILKTGTSIPVIPTSKDQTIGDYFEEYDHLNLTQWAPDTPSFRKQRMINGASEMRVKSRIAFLDTVNSGRIHDLEKEIVKILDLRDSSDIRVLLISSLSGGTGSGMFIQVALWLRKFFDSRNSEVSIRGIFLLPDIFVNNVENIGGNPKKKIAHYANAYAAIRELNTLNKIIVQGYRPDKRIVIDDLFDSDNPDARPVFDNAFFLDSVNARGKSFNTVGAYEEYAAQLAYMQLFAPMVDELVSVEDNLYRDLVAADEPIYGACGTSRALYPTQDVLEYCALCAGEEALATGWQKLDKEINRQIEQENAEILAGDRNVQSDPRDLYVELFDEKSNKKKEEIGTDGLFVSIKNDVNNEKREKVDGAISVEFKDKVEEFVKYIKEECVDTAVVSRGGLEGILCNDLPNPEKPENFTDRTIDKLIGVVKTQKLVVQSTIEGFEDNCDSIANSIVNGLMPLDMGAVNKKNGNSVYGLFVKENTDGTYRFIHPIAARYILCKLLAAIRSSQEELTPASSRESALEGPQSVSFDYPKSKRPETLENYWEDKRKKWHNNKPEIQFFIKAYKTYNQQQHGLCQQYMSELLLQKVWLKLSKRLVELLENMEEFFGELDDAVKVIKKEKEKNIKKNENISEQILYVNASKERKAAKYASLKMNLAESNDEISGAIINSIYGKVCANANGEIDENAQYLGISVVSSFLKGTMQGYKKQIAEKYEDKIFLSICQAIEEESEGIPQDKPEKKSSLSDGGLFDEVEETVEEIHVAPSIRTYVDRLKELAAPFLIAKTIHSQERDPNSYITTTEGKVIKAPLSSELIFWGFHPSTVKACPQLEEELGNNQATSASNGYGINEIYCYRSIYGVRASTVTKFNEMTTNGEYYTNYSAVIADMMRKNSEVHTPHLDKTWHNFLPYISKKKQDEEDSKFYRNFWLAVAYGAFTVERGQFKFLKRERTRYGSYDYVERVVTLDGRPVGTTEVEKLILAMRHDMDFLVNYVPDMQERYEEELQNLDTYVGTAVFQGLTTSNEDLNPINMIVRYCTHKNSSEEVKHMLVGALESIAQDLSTSYGTESSKEQREQAKYRLCKRIYDSGRMKKADIFRAWTDEFKKLKG